MSALEFMLLEQQHQQNPTNTLIMFGLGIGVLALMFFFISGANPLNIFKGLFTGGAKFIQSFTYSQFDSRKGRCGTERLGGLKRKRDCLQAQINYCSQGGVQNNGGGQNKKCFTDRGVPLCDRNEWCTDLDGNKVACPCYPDNVSCDVFKKPNNYNVDPNGAADQKCQGDLQGGPKCLNDCCAAQKAYCDGATGGSLLGDYGKCMRDRGCN